MNQLKISRPNKRGVLTAWLDENEIFIRESLDRGRDVQTVCVSRAELEKILRLEPDNGTE